MKNKDNKKYFNNDKSTLYRFRPSEIETFRQWFDCCQDCNPEYLTKKDYILARILYEMEKIRVPDSINDKINKKKLRLKK